MGPSEFYVYEHWRPDTGLPFYVGKGKGGRAHVLYKRTKLHQDVIQDLVERGLKVDVRIIKNGLLEREAFTFEMERIAFLKVCGIALVNVTNGGDGTWSLKYTDVRRAKLSKSLKGKVRSQEHARALAAANKGKRLSEEHKHKLSVAGKSRRLTVEHKHNISLALKGRPVSDEERIHLREIQKISSKVKRSPEARARMSAAQRKVVLSSEALERIRCGVSRAQTGRVPTEEPRLCMSVSHKGLKHPEETKQKIRLRALEREATKREVRRCQGSQQLEG